MEWCHENLDVKFYQHHCIRWRNKLGDITSQWQRCCVFVCALFRLLCGRTCCVRWVCSSTSHWTPLMGNRPDAPTAALHWASCLTTAVTLSPQVSLIYMDRWTDWYCISKPEDLATLCLFVCFCSFRGVGNQYSSAAGHQPRLDVLLLLRWHVYVLLRPLADLRVRNVTVRHVRKTEALFFIYFSSLPFLLHLPAAALMSHLWWNSRLADVLTRWSQLSPPQWMEPVKVVWTGQS